MCERQRQILKIQVIAWKIAFTLLKLLCIESNVLDRTTAENVVQTK